MQFPLPEPESGIEPERALIRVRNALVQVQALMNRSDWLTAQALCVEQVPVLLQDLVLHLKAKYSLTLISQAGREEKSVPVLVQHGTVIHPNLNLDGTPKPPLRDITLLSPSYVMGVDPAVPGGDHSVQQAIQNPSFRLGSERDL